MNGRNILAGFGTVAVAVFAAFYIISGQRCDVMSVPVVTAVVVLFFLSSLVLFSFRKDDDALFSPMAMAGLGILLYFLFPVIDMLLFPGQGKDLHLLYYGRLTGDDEPVVLKSVLLMILGLVFFYLGYVMRLGSVLSRMYLVPPEHISYKKLLPVVWLYLVFFAVVAFTLLHNVGGAYNLLTTPRGDRLFLFAKARVSSFMINYIFIIVFLVYFYHSNTASRGSFSLFIFTLIAVVVFFNIYNASRRDTIFIVMSLVVYHNLAVKKIRFKTVALLTAALLAFSIFMVSARNYLQNPDFRGSFASSMADITSSESVHDKLAVSMDYPYVYDALLNIISAVPERVPYLYGETFLKFVYFPIPRFIWPDKPETAARIIVKKFYPELYSTGMSISASPIGEGYFNFGALGVAGVMFVLGIIARSLKTYHMANKNNKGAVLLYAAMLPGVFEYFRGYFFETTLYYTVAALLLSLALFLSRGKAPQAVAEMAAAVPEGGT